MILEAHSSFVAAIVHPKLHTLKAPHGALSTIAAQAAVVLCFAVRAGESNGASGGSRVAAKALFCDPKLLTVFAPG